LLFYSRAPLSQRLKQEQAKESPDTSLVDDIETVLQFIHDDYGDTIADVEHLISLNHITYELLWVLFPPNTRVYRYHDLTEQFQVLVCCGVSYERNQEEGQYAKLSCEVITDDGSTFGLAWDYLKIKFFTGTSNIRDLPVYPLDYHKNKTNISEYAIRRGKKFTRISRQLFETSGTACAEERNFGQSNVYKVNVSTAINLAV
jgi:hypothetical protein